MTVRQAQLLGRQKTKKAVVTEALEEYIQRRRRQDIIKLFNKIEYEKDYDYKKQRKVK
ncbi:MAG: type II toxin-antitoxin system VapB family antitoxin [Candidatus Thiosymbion ectosymbiont of Robbea hypermnestra]|nr:type II toxin-antitoxin system VapB family antitoxin [Candidatus Thiosymbion ectosymbiont of Robbea hypermnestra]